MNETPTPAVVLVVGLGPLGRAIARAVCDLDHVVVRVWDPRPTGIQDLDQEWEPDLRRRIRDVQGVLSCAEAGSELRSLLLAVCAAMQVPLVDVQGHVAGVTLTPMQSAWNSQCGCPLCVTAHQTDRRHDAITHTTGGSDADLAVAAHLALLALLELTDCTGSQPTRETPAIVLDFASHIVKLEAVTPHPLCPRCFPVRMGTDRSSALSRTENLLRDIEAGDSHSLPEVTDLLPSLRKLAGDVHGLFAPPTRPMAAGRQLLWDFYRTRGLDPRHDILANAHSAVVTRTLALPNRTHRMVAEGFDFTHPRLAECLAFIEGLERLFALSLSVRDDVVTAPFTALEGDAFDPRTYPLYDDAQYAIPDVPLIRFDPGRETRWVTGVDLSAGRPLWIPYDLVYSDGSSPVLYRTNSSGAACHGNFRQAVINGLYELIERDAFQIAWLNRLSMPKIGFTPQQEDPWGLRASLNALDFTFDCVQLTSDLQVPVLMGVLRDRRDPNFFLTNMVACLDVRQALSKLQRELAQFLYPYLISTSHFVNACSTDLDPDRVLSFADHAGFYQTAERNTWAGFLTASGTIMDFNDVSGRNEQVGGGDALDPLLTRLSACGMRVMVVDCSPRLLRNLGLRAVKVIVAGLQQLEDQHRLRIPVRTRLQSQSHRSEADINPLPHPFW